MDEVAPMLQRVMGFTPPPAVVTAACEKYKLIGGKSPNVDIAYAIAKDLEAGLSSRGLTEELGEDIQLVEVAMGFTEPFLEDSLKRLADAGCECIVYLSMTAYESWAAWEGPYQRTVEAAAELGINEVVRAPVFGLSLAYVQAHADILHKTLAWLGATGGERIIFVAHSLPVDDSLETPERYEQQLLAAIDDVKERFKEDWTEEFPSSALAYVSMGARGGKWLGPSLNEAMRDIVASNAQTAIVCPLGFATDHMEVLYDLDIAAAKEAEALGLGFERTSTLATAESIHLALIEAMMESVQIALAEGRTP